MAGSLDLYAPGTNALRKGLKPVSLYGATAGGVWTPLLVGSTGAFPTPPLPTAAALTEAAISFNSIGDNTVIASTVSQTIRVFRMLFVVAGTANVTIKDGAASLTGAMPFVANGSFVLDLNVAEPWFVTAAGNAFVINLSAGVQVSGAIWYTKS